MQWLKSSNYMQSLIIKNKESGFSLIELSIVLIIIGLLVAGITGGQSLIESARARAVMNEARGYMQAVNTYYAANGRLPGDPLNVGEMGGWFSKYQENNYNFSSNYDQNIDLLNASWFDLNRESIVDWDANKDVSYGKESKYIKKAIYEFVYAGSNWTDGSASNTDYQKDLANKNIMDLTAKYDGYIPSRIAANIEEKMDDKSLDTGSIRMGYCSESIPNVEEDYIPEGEYGDITTYEDLVDARNGACDQITFRLDL